MICIFLKRGATGRTKKSTPAASQCTINATLTASRYTIHTYSIVNYFENNNEK